MSKDNKTELAKDPFRDFAFSRRGLFAALAVVAGLGAVPARSALANELVFRGDHITPGRGAFGKSFTSGDYIHCITHPDRTTNANNYGLGYACGWVSWVAADKFTYQGWNSSYLQALRYSLCLLVQCDYSNELYDHITAHPYMACGDINRQSPRRLWKNINMDDNHGVLFLNNAQLSTFSGDMLNLSAGERQSVNNSDWIDAGYDDYAYSKPEFFLRRAANPAVNTFRAEVDINNVMRDNKDGQAPYEKDLRSVTGNIDIDTEPIYIDNDVTLYGGIFSLAPLVMPDARVDLVQGVYDASGNPITNYDNERALIFWEDYDGINQLFMFKPYLEDGVGTFTFALANLAGPKLVHTLNNRWHADVNQAWKSGNMEAGTAVIYDIRQSSGRENSWWVCHEPAETSETNHKCYFITSDADGQRLDTAGATGNRGAVRVCSYAKPGEWGSQKNAQWKLIEGRCGGYVKNSKKTAKIGDSVTCIGFMPDSDETPTLTPSTWLHNVTNRKALPPQPMYRWYVTREVVDVPDDSDAVIMAHCSVSTWGKQTEAPAHRHIGYPHGGQSVYGLALHVVGSQFAGSICYAARACGSSTWETGRDGAEVCGSPIAEVKIWLTGELAENYDLCYRSIPLGGRWTNTVYSCGHADNDGSAAPACGSHGSAQMCGLNVHLIRKPRGSRLVKEFSFDDTIEVTEKIASGDDAVWLWSAAMMGITTVNADETRVWTDRMLGTVVVGEGIDQHHNPPTRLQSVVHFMVVDTLGDTQEVHTVYITLNSTYTASEHAKDYSDAHSAIEQVMRDEGQDLSLLDKCLDGWYEGDADCSDPSIFKGGKFVSKKVNGDLYLWTKVIVSKFRFYKDGLAKENLIFQSPRMLVGTHYTFPQEVIDRQLEPTCNLNDHFGTDPSTGFTGWHLNKTLSDQAITEHVATEGIVILYGRNRCTLRTEYAPGSVALDPSWDMRVLPEEDAEAHPGFIPTFTEPKHRGYDAKGKEFELAAIGDSGNGHTAYYWDELAHITVPATAYRNIGGGQWRTYKCEAWLDTDEANAAAEVSETGVSGRSRSRAASAVKMTADTVRYIRWTEVVSDGVVGVRRK
ncbi:MAG: hypothetical protein ACLUQH_06440 [Collinsella sp.]